MEEDVNEQKFSTIKTSLASIMHPSDNYNHQIILNAVIRVHEITIHMYQFLRLYILYKYQQNKTIPLITIDILNACFTVLTKSQKAGNKMDTIKS